MSVSFTPLLRMRIRFSRSTDGGVTWSTAADVAANLPSPGSFYLKNADKQFGMVADRGLDGNSFPTAAITPDGSIFVAWDDFSKGSCKQVARLGPVPPCSNSDVRLSVSRDGGATWTAPVKATDERGASDQFFPWLAAHPDGLVSLAWIDRRLDQHNIDYDLFYTNTYDGVNFLPNVRVTSATSILGLTTRIGDYNGMAGIAGVVFPAWGDLRNSTDIQIFSARGTLAP